MFWLWCCRTSPWWTRRTSSPPQVTSCSTRRWKDRRVSLHWDEFAFWKLDVKNDHIKFPSIQFFIAAVISLLVWLGLELVIWLKIIEKFICDRFAYYSSQEIYYQVNKDSVCHGFKFPESDSTVNLINILTSEAVYSSFLNHFRILLFGWSKFVMDWDSGEEFDPNPFNFKPLKRRRLSKKKLKETKRSNSSKPSDSQRNKYVQKTLQFGTDQLSKVKAIEKQSEVLPSSAQPSSGPPRSEVKGKQ